MKIMDMFIRQHETCGIYMGNKKFSCHIFIVRAIALQTGLGIVLINII